MGGISFDKVKEELFRRDPEFKAAYEALKPEFEIEKQLIEARIKSNMTKEQLAQKMDMKKESLARFERSLGAKLGDIIKYARALGMKELKVAL